MKEKLLFISLLLGLSLFITESHADRVDQIESMSNTDYCSVVADQFYAGAQAQLGGFARVFKVLSPVVVEMIEHHIPVPKDAMYVPQWDQLTERERQWMSDNVLTGYDEAAKIPGLTDEQAMKMAQTVFEGCMYKRTAQKRVDIWLDTPITKCALDTGTGIGTKVASSEKLGKRIQECKEKFFDHMYIDSALRNHVPKHIVEQKAKSASNLTYERKVEVLKLVDEAYASPDWSAEIQAGMDACVDGAR